jgi:hypothetical protein
MNSLPPYLRKTAIIENGPQTLGILLYKANLPTRVMGKKKLVTLRRSASIVTKKDIWQKIAGQKEVEKRDKVLKATRRDEEIPETGTE